MKKDPTYDMTQFPAYITVRQKALLKEASKDMHVPISELLREAIHYWLKKEGRDDGLMFDSEEFYEGWKRGVVEMAQKNLRERESHEAAKRYALRIEQERKEAKARKAAKNEACE